MNVLIVNTVDIHGGAAIAAYRLMNALRTNGVAAKMLVRDKRSGNEHVKQVGGKIPNKLCFYAERGVIFLQNRFSREYLFDVSIANAGVSITQLPEFAAADVIHLHWINQGMLSMNEIGKILSTGKKVVWTMHDMWPFTGICHHAAGCTHFRKGCGNCRYLRHPAENDLSHSLFNRKASVYALGNIHFVACSQWLKKLAQESPLTRHHAVSDIPNPLDISAYAPKDKAALRKSMHLPSDKKIILFASVKASDKRKGMDYLVEASKRFENKEVLFLIAGSRGADIAEKLSAESRALEYVPPEQMAELYAVSDLFVTPSLQENLPNTLMEAMACGTPCVGFETGGIPEMIHHRINGYVAQYRNADDLARGIRWVLFEADYATLSENARQKVLSEYVEGRIANRYLKIYEE